MPAFFLVLIWMLYRLRVHSVEQRYLERSRAKKSFGAPGRSLRT